MPIAHVSPGSPRFAGRPRGGPALTAIALTAIALVAGCSPTARPVADPVAAPGAASTPPSPGATDTSITAGASVVGGTSAATAPAGSAVSDMPPGTLRVDATGPSREIHPRLFGTNVPAWLGPTVLESDWFLAALSDAGVTTIRMPGGSWSNTYPWDACELRQPECWAVDSARPADFASLLVATGLEGMWTVSANASAQSSAALVAYFNGDAADTRAIGVDRYGVDWGTVGEWASLRGVAGHADPVRIARWEVGNEVWGGRPDAGGEECAAFGWENVWTCDGREYMQGDADHDGFIDVRAAMTAVDPSIEVGAVGVPSPGDWSNWGAEVLEFAESIDFYVVHDYGFASSPSASAAVVRPAEQWPPIAAGAAPQLGGERLAITEYNLVSFEAGDSGRSMITVANAFFVADTLGQFAVGGVGAANHWNAANGTTESGTDYGLVQVETQQRFPAFHAFEAWSLAGPQLLTGTASDTIDGMSVYPTLRDDGSLAVIVLNPHDARQVPLDLIGVSGDAEVTLVSFTGADLAATTMERVDADLGPLREVSTVDLAAASINVIVVGNA